jgi:hypothetical protein
VNTTQTVLALPTVGEAHALLDELSTRALIGPLILLSEQEIAEELVSGQRAPIDLQQRLAELRLTRLRVVSVTMGVGGSIYGVRDVAATVSGLRSRSQAAGIDFSAVSLVICDGETKAPADAFHADWEGGLLFVPEDGAGSRGMMTVDLTADKVPHVAVSAAATCGALWAWSETAPFDGHKSEFIQGERYASLARLAVRIVDAGDIAAQIVNSALDPRGVWPLPRGCVAVNDPKGAAQTLAQHIASAPEIDFSFERLRPPESPRPQRVGILSALALFFRRLWSHLRAMPGRRFRELRDAAIDRVEDAVQQRTFGDDSQIAIRIDAPGAMMPEITGSPTDLSGSATLLRPIRHEPPEPSAARWDVLRSVVFGSIDGSDFRGSLRGRELEWQGSRAVFADRTDVAALSDAGITNAFVADASELNEEASDEKISIHPADVAAARALHERIPQSAEQLRERFDSWIEERRHTLIWKIGEHLSRSVESSWQTLQECERELLSFADELRELEASNGTLMKRARRRTVIFLVLLLMLVAASVIGFLFVAALVGAVALAVLMIALLATGWSFLSIAREEVRIEFRLRQLQTRPSHLEQVRQHAAHEFDRLNYLTKQYLDWSEVYTHILHRPWGENVEGHLHAVEPWASPANLYSLTCAVPTIDEERVQGEILTLRRQICRPGWLSSTFQDHRKLWQDRYERISGYSEDEDTSPEEDASASDRPLATMPTTGEAIHHPRTQFSNDVVAGRHTPEVRVQQINRMRSSVETQRAARLVRSVSCDLPGLDGSTVREYLASLVEFSPLRDFGQYMRPTLPPAPPGVEQSMFGISTSVTFEEPIDGTQRHRLPISELSDRLVLASFRLDVSHRVRLDAIDIAQGSAFEGVVPVNVVDDTPGRGLPL